MKQTGVIMDLFTWGLEPLGLILFFGDLTAARHGFAKVKDAHQRMLVRVKQGVASAERCVHRSRTAHARSCHALTERHTACVHHSRTIRAQSILPRAG